jgi:flagellar hook-basal body protein
MSLYGMMRTGVSGMAAQSTRLATVADNIANSGTNGYKRASVEFSSLVIPNSGTNYVSGGVATTIRYAISQTGNTQYTTSGTDLSIKGNGFFVVQNSNEQPFLTRAGSFVPDNEGRLVNAAGFYLMGYSYENGIPSPVANGYAGLETVRISNSELQATPTTLGKYSANLPYTASVVPAADLPSTNSANAEFTNKRSLVVYDNVGQEVLLDIFFTRTGTATAGTTMAGPPVGGYSAAATPIADGANADLTFAGFTGLAWADGDTASFTVDIDGTAVDVTGTYSGGAWSFAPDDPASMPAGATLTFDTSGPDLVVNVDNATGAGITVSANGFTSTTPVPATADTWEMTVFYQPNAAATTSFPYSQPPLETATLEFDQYGKLIGPTNLTIDLTGLNGEAIDLDLSGMTQLAAEFTQGEATRNGNGPAAVEGVVIGTDGIIYAQYANGATAALYRLPIATVQSPDQLQVLPGNVFSAGLNSGDVQIGFAGSGGLGDVIAGSVENSNVDIAEELTNMIESQRNYTANSKVFQTGSDLMDVLVNLKR